MMISVWWVIVAAFAGIGIGMFIFALMSMAGSETSVQLLPAEAGVEQTLAP